MDKQYCGYCGYEKSPINLCCCGGRCITDEDLEKLKRRNEIETIFKKRHIFP